MDAGLKQRLVGAAVLVAVAVIVVPMLLDGGYRPPNVNTRDMAPMPADQLPQTVEPLPPETVDVIDRGVVAPPTELESSLEVPPPRVTTAAPVPPVRKPRPVEQPAQIESRVERSPPPSAVVPPAAVERWAVQLGSFSSRDNADLLVRRLESVGTKAHIVQIKEAHGVSFRVRAGPTDGRAAALDLRNRLAKSPDLRGILVRE